MRNILAIGAYERDNFGDYLFYEILRRALPQDFVIPGSVISADVIEQHGFVTIPYDFILKQFKVDAVWVVGGEVGGVNIPIALDMSIGLNSETYNLMSEQQKGIVELLLGASRKNSRAYIPDVSLYTHNRGVPLFIHSVGLSNLLIETQDNLKLLNQSVSLVVRDDESFDIAQQSSVTPVLGPDVVHSISKYYTPIKRRPSGYVLIQINIATINEHGPDTIAHMIKAVYRKVEKPIILFSAGQAKGHDSDEYYENIKRLVHDVPIEILKARQPMLIVDEIAHANLVIATSLHARIIAATYGIKRISIENEKVRNYSELWDNQWPHSVMPADIDAALDSVDLVDKKYLKRSDLTENAYKNLNNSIKEIPNKDTTNKTDILDLTRRWLVEQQKISFTSLHRLYTEVSTQHTDLLSKEEMIGDLSKEIEEIKKLRLWKLHQLFIKIKSKTSRQNRP